MEVLFYHLERQPLEAVLPVLLQKSLERGWRAVVQTGSPERAEALCDAIWTWRDDVFVPHGTQADGHAADQPVWITPDSDSPNNPQIRFMVDGADGADETGLERIIYMFDGRDEEAVQRAREQWKRNNAAGHQVTYWQQDDQGRWQKKA